MTCLLERQASGTSIMAKKKTFTWSVKILLQIVYNVSRIYVKRLQCRLRIVDVFCKMIFTEETYSNVSFFQDDDSDDVLCIETPGLGVFKTKREKEKGTTKVSYNIVCVGLKGLHDSYSWVSRKLRLT